MLKIMLVQEPEGTRVILAGRLVVPGSRSFGAVGTKRPPGTGTGGGSISARRRTWTRPVRRSCRSCFSEE